MSPDPLADFFPGITPYNYAQDNPINNIDFDGLGPRDWIEKIKKFFYKLFHKETESISRYSRIKHHNYRAKGGGGGSKVSEEKNNQETNENRTSDPVDPIASIGFPRFDNTEKPDFEQIADIPTAPPTTNINNGRDPEVGGNKNKPNHKNAPNNKKSVYYATVKDMEFVQNIIENLSINPWVRRLRIYSDPKDNLRIDFPGTETIRFNSVNCKVEYIISILKALNIESLLNVKIENRKE